jgi:hypothetical protein
MNDLQKKHQFLTDQIKNIDKSIMNFLSYKKKINDNDKKIINSFQTTKILINNEIKNLINPQSKEPPKIENISNIDLFKKICVSLAGKIKNEYPKIDKNSKKKSLLIETRILPETEFIIKNTIQKLGDGWGHLIFCHENNYNQIKKICSDISDQIEIKKIESTLTRNTYNNMCLDLNFWENINCEKVLVYQTDTFIFKNFNDKFLDYDWIGTTWNDAHAKYIEKRLGWGNLWGCNGGLNIRTVSVIKEILKNHKPPKDIFGGIDFLPEDTYFSWHIKHNYNFPPKYMCDLFSNDKNFELDIFGTHQPWNGKFNEFIKKIKNGKYL